MAPSRKSLFSSGQAQLNIIGLLLILVLGFSAWQAAQPLNLWSVLPLGLIGYAAFRVVWELTFNRKNVPTLATSHAGRGKMTDMLKREAGQFGDGYTVIDLGSGRGELTRHIARAIPSARVIGIEMSRIPFWQSVWLQRWFGPSNLSYQCLDFWPYDCSKINAVVFYLSMPVAQRVGAKLFQELRPGSLVISHTFPLLDNWVPVETITFRTPFKETIYVYRKP